METSLGPRETERKIKICLRHVPRPPHPFLYSSQIGCCCSACVGVQKEANWLICIQNILYKMSIILLDYMSNSGRAETFFLTSAVRDRWTAVAHCRHRPSLDQINNIHATPNLHKIVFLLILP